MSIAQGTDSRVFTWMALVAALLGWALCTPEAQATARVENISVNPRSDGQGYVVRVHTSGPVTAYGMPKRRGNEITWTLYNTTLADVYQPASPGGAIQRLTTEMNDGHLTLHFAFEAQQQVQAAAYRDRNSNDLLLGLTVADARPPARTVSANQPADVPVTSVSERASSSSASAEAQPERNSEASPARATNSDRWKLDTVVIDPGHGGIDPGTQGHGLDEKDIVLSVSKKLGAYLEDKLGLNVVYTRTTDKLVELQERGRIANEAGGKLFISIHANAASSPYAKGTETFFLGMHKTEAAKRVMERENKVVKLEENPEQYEKLDEEALVRYALTQSMNMQQSEHFAALIEKQFENRVHRNSRGVKQAGFRVLWGASMPAVLVELGFLTNTSDARFLSSEKGQVYMASALFRAVRDYKKDYEKGMNLVRSE